MSTHQTHQRRTRVATNVLLTVTLLLAATTAYILFDPISPSNFESTTGVSWEAFAASNPEVADYLSREGRLLAIGYLGLTLLVAAVVWGPLRRGEGWTMKALWLFPITLMGAALVFLISGDGSLGGTYLTAALVAAVSLGVLGSSAKTDGSIS